ncbi:MAG: NAD(P)/FAD-dependent oxidoreductase [Anaeroplasmataceae bacterium]
MKVALIGAGASALMIASIINNNDVYVFEKNASVASKLRASGNGKANILNINAKSSDYNNSSFVQNIFDEFSPKQVYDYFKQLGLYMRQDDEGRVYPLTDSSKTVVDILLHNCSNTNLILDYTVTSIKKINNKYQINNYNVLFDKVVVCSGSKASIKNNPNSMYNFIDKKYFTKLNPSLVGFKISETKLLSGFRSKANVSLVDESNNIIHSEFGEVIFKDDGISGIVIMNMSCYYNRSLNKNLSLNIDILPSLEESMLNDSNKIGILHPKLIEYINTNKIPMKKLKQLQFKIISTYDYINAQTISGGVSTKYLNDDLSLIDDNNIYFVGEVIDIDGICGGYNLLFAFASAMFVANKFKK